uniref:Uncharacterized protein n=1 Tax=Rhizophora mucronata TaxID=61149 RepID=A0A2P2MRN8_RHIMU
MQNYISATNYLKFLLYFHNYETFEDNLYLFGASNPIHPASYNSNQLLLSIYLSIQSCTYISKGYKFRIAFELRNDNILRENCKLCYPNPPHF